LLHPELVIGDATKLSDDQKNAILKQCLNLAIDGETYECTPIIYPEFAAQARTDRDQGAEASFQGQVDESKEHAGLFHTTAKTLACFPQSNTTTQNAMGWP
jgi:rubrerythrin